MSCPLHTNTTPCSYDVVNTYSQTYINLVTTLFTLRCPETDWCVYPDNQALFLRDSQEFDYIVVGAGASGSVVAERLSEDRKSTVLVLEAGAYPGARSEIPSMLISTWGTQIDWNYTTSPEKNNCEAYKGRMCRLSRGKCLGGSTSINAMLYIRGHKNDYDSWQAAGNDGWSYDSIFKYFLKSENLMTPEMLDPENRERYGSGGFQAIGIFNGQDTMREIISKGAQALGVPTVDAEGQLGFFDSLQTIDYGIRANAGKEFLGKNKNRSNLIVSLNSHVERITFQGNTATGVVARINSRQMTLRANKEVIISAGALNSPVILMNSGIGPRSEISKLGIMPRAVLPVGKNLQDHFINFAFLVTISPDAYETPPELQQQLAQYLSNASGPLGSTGLGNLLGFINTRENNTNYPNVQYTFNLFPYDDTQQVPELIRTRGLPDKISNFIRDVTQFKAGFIIYTNLLHPKSRGEVLLNTRDPQGMPRIYPRYMSNDEDTKVMIEGIRFAEKLVETVPFKAINATIENIPMGCDDFTFRSDDYWRCTLQKLGSTMYHPAGTCKMGKIEDGGVVDSRLRVHGFKRLRVIDASIMPTITSGNLQAPCLMIGQKGADMIIEDNQ